MNARERVPAVLNHQLPDRVPNGLSGCETAGLHIVAYDNLQKVLGLEANPPRLDTFMTNAVFEEPVIRAFLDKSVEAGHQSDPDLRADMSADSLKARFGKDVVFWGGGYDARLIDDTASYNEVYQTVYNNI